MSIEYWGNWITREVYARVGNMEVTIDHDNILAPIGAIIPDGTLDTLYQIQSVYSSVLPLIALFYEMHGRVDASRRLPRLNQRATSITIEHSWVIWQSCVEIEPMYRDILFGMFKAALNTLNRAGYVYLIRSASGYWKIGRTKSPKDRLKTFSVKLPFEVTLDHSIICADMHQAEKMFHRYFDAKRCGKSEFFDLSPEDVRLIKSFWFMNRDGIAITNTRQYQGIPGISYRWIHEMLA